MEIKDIHSFLAYYAKIKNRTRQIFSYIPTDKIEWTYQTGKFTIGDLIRHLACIERYMYAENVQGKSSLYNGCGIEYAEGLENVIAFYNELHTQSVEIFSKLNTRDLNRKCKTPAGIEITTWKWLRAMVEHEIHHRGQLFTYLGMLDIKLPPLYGLTAEQVIAKSNS